MEFTKAVCVLGILLLTLAGGVRSVEDVGSYRHLKRCEFPAIYNFGDSNSGTGGRSAAIGRVPSPNGETFFHKPSGRACDGRLIIDFISERLRLPYLSAYLDSIGANFSHGANFATGGSSILPGGYSPFHLDLQISQFIQFKSCTTALFKQITVSENGEFFVKVPVPLPREIRTALFMKSTLPRPQDFSKALYTFDIGQNDLAHGFEYSTPAHVQASIPKILDEFAQATIRLYEEGARVFWVHNTGPIGCLLVSVFYYQSEPKNWDQNGCVLPQNEVAQEFNRQLKQKLSQLKAMLPHAAFTYVDVYSAKFALISNAKKQGFVDPFNICCGRFYGVRVDRGYKVLVNGTVYGNSCKNPFKHISWDGIHYSEAANRLLSQVILNGTWSEPRISIEEACLSPRNV